jgi:hypothetical protein
MMPGFTNGAICGHYVRATNVEIIIPAADDCRRNYYLVICVIFLFHLATYPAKTESLRAIS